MKASGFSTFGLALVLSASIVSIANAGQHVWTELPSPIRATAQPGSCEHLSLHYPGGGQPLHFCGTLAELVHEVLVCRARYDALTDDEQQSVVGMKLFSRCDTLYRARDGVIAAETARQHERQRIEDAQRQLEALGAEQPAPAAHAADNDPCTWTTTKEMVECRFGTRSIPAYHGPIIPGFPAPTTTPPAPAPGYHLGTDCFAPVFPLAIGGAVGPSQCPD